MGVTTGPPGGVVGGRVAGAAVPGEVGVCWGVELGCVGWERGN